MWLTGDIYTIISWHRLWEERRLAILTLPIHRVAWNLFARWRPPTMLKKTPRPTVLERQVQTLTAAVERLTKQNNDLEEQLRQRNAGHNTQEEDQEGISADKGYHEGSEGSHAPSRLERLDVSRPSTTNMALPHIVTEMQMMRERMDLMMNALRGQVLSDLDDLVHRTESPSPYPSIPSPYHRSFECRRWRAMMETRTLWITWNLSRP